MARWIGHPGARSKGSGPTRADREGGRDGRRSQDGPATGRTLICNVSCLLSGDPGGPVPDSDCLLIDGGTIAQIGGALAPEDADRTLDAGGSAVCPGLIDSHCHPVFGDWTARQNQLGWIETGVNGGVTTLLSAGEVHLPGRPKDRDGVKALAMVAQRCFQNFRPLGAKVLAGAPVMELGFDEAFVAELAAAGIRHIGEIGLGTVARGEDAARVTAWRRAHRLETITHSGGPSIAGPHFVSRDDVLMTQPDVVSHINGGPTSIARDHVRDLCEQATGALQVVHNAGRLAELLIGTDAPAGSGVQPNGMLRMMALMASLGGLPAELAVCLATGSGARRRNLAQGVIAPGRPADLVFLDRPEASAGREVLEAMSFGDIPGIGGVMIDGKLRCGRSRSTRLRPGCRYDAMITGIRKLAVFVEQTHLETGQGISPPPRKAAAVAGFLKLGARKYLVISIAMVAASLRLDRGRIVQAAVAVGSCSPVARRLAGLEQRLVGVPLPQAAAQVRASDAAHLSPLTDIRADAACRTEAVPMDGAAVCACLAPLGRVGGAVVETVTAPDAAILPALQASFQRHGAAQCGICTPGMLMAATALLRATPDPTLQDAEAALSGVLCRCTGYGAILRAVVDWRPVPHSAPAPAGAAVGASVERLDGWPKVQGQEAFGADGWPEGTALVRLVRSLHAQARFTLGDAAGWTPRWRPGRRWCTRAAPAMCWCGAGWSRAMRRRRWHRRRWW